MSEVHRVSSLTTGFESAANWLETRAYEVLVGNDHVPPMMTSRILGTLVSREVAVEAASAVSVDKPLRTVSVAFTIMAAAHPDWFPVFSGDLEVIDRGGVGIEVALEGSYSVPGGVVGRLADRGGLHRVADDSIDRFFLAIVSRLESS